MDNEKICSINVKNLRDQLDRLSNVKDKPIKSLNGKDLEDFTAVSHNISNLYGSDGYNLLFKEIQDRFPICTKVVPGTVGGYLFGCFTPAEFKYGDTCSLGCVTGAPLFYDHAEMIPCNRNVFIAPYELGYTFTKLTSGTEEIDTAILFIQPPFQGFSVEEIYQLRKQGLEKVIMSYYDEQKGEYFVSDPLPFSKIQKRNSFIRNVKVDTRVSKTERIFQTIGVVLLLLLAGYALWSMRNN
jgi:hypothetical protein